MDPSILDGFSLDAIRAFSPNSFVAVTAGAFLLAAALTALGVPGTIVPLSFTAGAILGAELGGAAVAAGGAVGSQGMMLAARHFLRDRTREKLGNHLIRVEEAFARGGAWYVLFLRVVGAPNAVLTGACALLPITPAKFALTSFVGLLPAAMIASSMGSSF